MSTQPAHEIRLGRVRATIWANSSDEATWYSVVFTRLYKAADQWQDSGSFGRDDLLLVAKAADLAHSWVLQQTQE